MIEKTNLEINKIFKYFTFLLAAIMLIITAYSTFFITNERERNVVLRYGKIVDIAEPGLGFKIPFVDGIEKISLETFSVTYPKLNAYSKDQQPATLKVSVTFKIDEKRVKDVYTDYRNVENLVSRVIDRNVPTELENVFGQYTAISAVQDRANFVIGVTKAIKQSVEKSPLDILSVQIENLDFSNAYEKSVEDRMKAEVEVQTQLQNLEKERVSAQIAVTQAQAVADSSLAKAKAEAESIRIKGEAEASAIRSRAEALSKNQDLVELTKAEKWNGVLPTTMLPNSTLPFFETSKLPK